MMAGVVPRCERIPFKIEDSGCFGVDGSFNVSRERPSKKTKSVNVPPVSMPILFMTQGNILNKKDGEVKKNLF